jgi:hypothetical protein
MTRIEAIALAAVLESRIAKRFSLFAFRFSLFAFRFSLFAFCFLLFAFCFLQLQLQLSLFLTYPAWDAAVCAGQKMDQK